MKTSSIIDAITYEIKSSATSAFLDPSSVFVCDEQSISENTELKDDSIYVIVSFMDAVPNGKQTITGVTLTIIGTSNKIKPTQLLANTFCEQWNLVVSDKIGGQQVWSTPKVLDNFNDTDAAYRSSFTVNGTLVIGENLEYVKVTYKSQDVFLMGFSFSRENSLSPQAFSSNAAIDQSMISHTTDGLIITTVATTDNYLVNDAMASALSSTSSVIGAIFPITFTIGGITYSKNMVLSSVKIGQKIGASASISMAFTFGKAA
jgi:hypothetical protein